MEMKKKIEMLETEWDILNEKLKKTLNESCS